jgi:hypothetical protein
MIENHFENLMIQITLFSSWQKTEGLRNATICIESNQLPRNPEAFLRKKSSNK